MGSVRRLTGGCTGRGGGEERAQRRIIVRRETREMVRTADDGISCVGSREPSRREADGVRLRVSSVCERS